MKATCAWSAIYLCVLYASGVINRQYIVLFSMRYEVFIYAIMKSVTRQIGWTSLDFAFYSDNWRAR